MLNSMPFVIFHDAGRPILLKSSFNFDSEKRELMRREEQKGRAGREETARFFGEGYEFSLFLRKDSLLIWGAVDITTFYSLENIDEVYRFLEDQLEKLVLIDIDPLSGLGNRRALIRERVFDRLVLIDVDNFKELNDRRGHLEGDKLISFLGASIKRAFQKSFRYGGDEFVILTSEEEISIGRKIDLIESEIKAFGDFLSLSFGVSSNNDLTQAISEADKRLYSYKQSRRDFWK